MTPKPSPSSVAVIVTTRDRPALLADALRSVAAQTTTPHEIVIADDGERALGALEPPGGIPLRVVRVVVRNPGAARNRAAAHTGAAWLAFLDDDDRWLPEHLAGFAPVFEDPDGEVAYRDCAVIRESLEPDGSRVEHERIVIARDWDPSLMRTDDYIPPSSILFRRSLFSRLRGFDESLARSEDWDLLLRASRETRPRRLPGVTVEVRLRGQGNASADAGPERRACLDRLAKRHDLPPLEIKTFWEVARDLQRPDAGSKV